MGTRLAMHYVMLVTLYPVLTWTRSLKVSTPKACSSSHADTMASLQSRRYTLKGGSPGSTLTGSEPVHVVAGSAIPASCGVLVSPDYCTSYTHLTTPTADWWAAIGRKMAAAHACTVAENSEAALLVLTFIVLPLFSVSFYGGR